MARIKRDTENVQADKYYIWTWVPKKWVNYSCFRSIYQKHYCAQPFYTRYHAKKTAILHLGVDALQYIRIVSGRYLLKRGITKFQGRWKLRVFYKDSPRGMPPWVIPPEFRFDKHRRRHFANILYRKFKRGRKKFNQFYAFVLYGYTETLDKKYLIKQRSKLGYQILQNLQKTGDI